MITIHSENIKINEDWINQISDQFSTNEILIQDTNNKTFIYLPCYVRLKVKEIINVDVSKLKGIISGTLLFSFYYGELNQHLLQQFVGQEKKSIMLQLSKQQSVYLKEGKGIMMTVNDDEKIIDFVVRQDFVCNLKGDVYLTPFQIIDLFLTITIQSVVLNPAKNKEKRIQIKFNCMGSSLVSEISHNENCRFGKYTLARYFVDSAYKNSQIVPFKDISFAKKQPTFSMKDKIRISSVSKDQIISLISQNKIKQQPYNHFQFLQGRSQSKQGKNQKLKNFQYAHFRIPLYKYPGESLSSIFIPLWLIGLINLSIFFQDNQLVWRIQTMIYLNWAYIEFIPTINKQIPQTSSIKFIQILIYIQFAASVICLIQSLLVRNVDMNEYKFVWFQDVYFIAALAINLISVILVGIIFLIHKLCWQVKYNMPRVEKQEQFLKKQYWRNIECDNQFLKWFNNDRIRYYQYQ